MALVTPPASGLTTVKLPENSSLLNFLIKYFTATFYASRLSTGTVKNPYAYPLWRSMVITLSAPMDSINLATSAAEIGTLGAIFPK